MKRLLLSVLLSSLLASGCAMLPGTGQPSTAKDLGGETVDTASSPADATKELRSGATWLWQAVARLQTVIEAIQAKAPVEAAALEETLDQVRVDCHDAETAIGGEVDLAKNTWRKARSAVGKVAAACLAVAIRAGMSDLVALLGGVA